MAPPALSPGHNETMLMEKTKLHSSKAMLQNLKKNITLSLSQSFFVLFAVKSSSKISHNNHGKASYDRPIDRFTHMLTASAGGSLSRLQPSNPV